MAESVDTPPPRADAEQWVGRVIDDRYRITRLIGVGGMGLVFEAEQLTLKKPVALKLVQAEFVGNGEVAARFAREAMASARVDHPHVASAIDFGKLPDGTTYLVMQLVRGENLAERMCRAPVPWATACEVAAQIADALAAAHREGIIHRDLKPDNVMLSPRDDGSLHVRVLDFGIARVPAEPHAAPEGAKPHRALTKIGTVVGTPGYMAPEQALDEPVGPKSDLYTLGILLWEMITGKELFPESDLTRIVTRQLSEPVPRIREASGDRSVPDDVQAMLDELLAGQPDLRPREAATVRDTLRSIVARKSLDELVRASTPVPDGLTARTSDEAPTQRLVGVGGTPGATAPAIPSARGEAEPGRPRTATPARRRGSRPTHPVRRAAVVLALVLASLAVATMLKRGEKPTPWRAEVAPTWPESVEADLRVMLASDGYERRKRAAERLLAHEPPSDVPDFARAVAQLELGSGCADRAEAIGAVAEAGDPRALPALRRLQHMPADGCGEDGAEDCYGCLRDELMRAARHLRAIRDRQDVAPPETTPTATVGP